MLPTRIAVIGGSTVYGEGDPSGGGFTTRLRAWHNAANAPNNCVFNLGIRGESVGQIAKRAHAEALCRKPELIILYPGLNDMRRAHGTGPLLATMAKVGRRIENLVDQLLEICPVLLMSCTPPDENRTSPFYGHWHFKRDDVAELALTTRNIAEQKSLPYFDLYERWSQRDDLDALMADGLHLNAEGHRLLFEELKAMLEALYKEAEAKPA